MAGGNEDVIGRIFADGPLCFVDGGKICVECGLIGIDAVGGLELGPLAHGAFPFPGGLVLEGGGGLLLFAHGATPVTVEGGFDCCAQGATPVTVEGGFFPALVEVIAQGATPVTVEGGAAPFGGRADGGGIFECRPLLLGGGLQSPIPACSEKR